MATKRQKRNRGGRPVTVNASATYLLKLPPELLEEARAAARAEGIPLAQWWRTAGAAVLARRRGSSKLRPAQSAPAPKGRR